MNNITEEKCAGYISLVFFDDTSNEVVTLGGAGFLTAEDVEAHWCDLVPFDGASSFQADRQDAQGDIIDEKAVSAEECERLVGKPIATLIAEGRAKLAAELAEYRKAA